MTKFSVNDASRWQAARWHVNKGIFRIRSINSKNSVRGPVSYVRVILASYAAKLLEVGQVRGLSVFGFKSAVASVTPACPFRGFPNATAPGSYR